MTREVQRPLIVQHGLLAVLRALGQMVGAPSEYLGASAQ
jgi:hypothetical protein